MFSANTEKKYSMGQSITSKGRIIMRKPKEYMLCPVCNSQSQEILSES